MKTDQERFEKWWRDARWFPHLSESERYDFENVAESSWKAALRIERRRVKEPKPTESEYAKSIRTGVKPDIWPPLIMTRDDLKHFRCSHGKGGDGK